MKKFYITTSIAYTNGPPHLGFALELIQADVMARQKRLLGENVWFLTGTDEHGLKVAQKAKKLTRQPQDFCNEIVAQYEKLIKEFNISNNDFIRTTDQKRHWPGVRKLWAEMNKAGDIYKKDYEGLYCLGCESFIKEKELVAGQCPYHQKKPERIKEENYFFRLSKYSDQIINILNNKTIEIIPSTKTKEMISLAKEGLEDISFSRPKDKMEWGIPVPGDESQLIYVWGDALTNYLSAIGYGWAEDNFEKYWPADIHFIGKDISKFHTLIWPGMLLSVGLPLPKKVFIHGFLTADGQKMSKSIGNVIDPFVLLQKYGTDPVRYFFLREISATEDGDFSFNKFEERYNADLASGLGNLTARIITLAGRIKTENILVPDGEIINEIEKTKESCQVLLNNFKFNIALEKIWNLIAFSDHYIETKRPWETEDKKVINNLLFLLNSVAHLIEPFLPQTAVEIKRQIKEKKSQPLFRRIVS